METKKDISDQSFYFSLLVYVRFIMFAINNMKYYIMKGEKGEKRSRRISFRRSNWMEGFSCR